MSTLRDLLHDAAPIATREVDLDAVHARVRQRARRRRALVGGVAALLVLAIGATALAVASRNDDGRRIDVVDDTTTTVPGTTVPGAPSTSAPATSAPVRPPVEATTIANVEWGDDFVPRALAMARDQLWIAGVDQEEGWALRRYTVDSGALRDTVPLPGAVRDIVVEGDELWLWGGGDGGEPVGGVGLVDAASGTLVATFGWEQDAPEDEWRSIQGLALLDGDAWVSNATGDEVIRLRVVEGRFEESTVATGRQPTDIVIEDDQVWVRESLDGTAARIDPTTMSVVERNGWDGSLLAWDPITRTVWTSNGAGLEARIGVRTGEPVQRLPHPGVDDVIIDGLDLWVREEDRVLRYRRSLPGDALVPVETWSCGTTDIALGGDTLWWACGDFAGRWDLPNRTG